MPPIRAFVTNQNTPRDLPVDADAVGPALRNSTEDSGYAPYDGTAYAGVSQLQLGLTQKQVQS